jgi:hypothetical protein
MAELSEFYAWYTERVKGFISNESFDNLVIKFTANEQPTKN